MCFPAKRFYFFLFILSSLAASGGGESVSYRTLKGGSYEFTEDNFPWYCHFKPNTVDYSSKVSFHLNYSTSSIFKSFVFSTPNPSTLYGLSGIGDLIATCNSPTSRNYKVGYLIGQGKKLDEILANLGSVAEGVKTAEAVYNLSKKYNVEMPL